MTHARPIAPGPVALVLLLLLAALPALAQRLPGSAGELEAYASLDARKYATARRQAEAILDEGPSLIATFVLGSVHYRGEGNHPRGLFLVREAKRMLVERYGEPPDDVAWQLWHKRIMLEEQWLLGEMDRREDQLKALDEHDRFYQPPMEVRRIWPLLKLGRFDEARAIGNRYIHDDDQWVRERAYNGLMAVEDEARNRQASYDWGQKGLTDSRKESCIIATNLALAARRCFKFGEAEEYDQIALKANDQSCPTPPYNQLAVVHLIQGRYQQSLSAIKELRKQPRTPDVRVQNEMDIRARLTELLYAMGQHEQAEKRVREIIARPDRAGLTSASAENIRLANHTLFHAVITARIHQQAERAAVRNLLGSWEARWQAQQLGTLRFEHARQAMKLAAEPQLVVDMVRPYYTDTMPWYSATLIDMLGTGVIQGMVRQARQMEPDFPELAGAYLDAMAGEVAWREGDWAQAVALADAALAKLPEPAVLLRHRVRAWRADALTRQGGDPRDEWAAVMNRFPTVMRLLDLALPVTVTHDGSAAAADAAERLGRSPRLAVRAGGAPFEVRLNAAEKGLSLCLYSAGGGRVNCAESEDGLEEAGVITACDLFHDTVFAPKVSLTQSDINSLDGRPQRVSAQDALKGLFGDFK
ncbi:MAG: hypothetical protein KC613_17755 [Myxococcales bacterium]|nr:hypothetical protein [Myxococcales bacterium]MCB9524640.1 hypothetical protein [Myxococcales bacterium]